MTPILSTKQIENLSLYIYHNRTRLGFHQHITLFNISKTIADNNNDHEKLYCTLEDYLSTDTNPFADIILQLANR